MNFGYLKTYTTYSLRKSVIKPPDLLKQAKNNGATYLSITEKGNLYSAIKIAKSAKDNGIKPILGCDLYIRGDDNQLSNLTLLCKNLEGWKSLLKIIAYSNSKDNYDVDKEIPTITFLDLITLASTNFIVYAGCLNSWLVPSLTECLSSFIKTETYEQAKNLICPDWRKNLDYRISQLQDVFSKDNVFLEIQDIENQSIPAADIVSKIVKNAAKRLKIKAIGTCKPHYLKPEDAEDQKILICVDKKATFRNIEEKLQLDNDTEYFSFFRNNNSYLLSQEEFKKTYVQEVLENNGYVASLCESFNILNNPKIPKFACPEGQTDVEYLSQLCEIGFAQKVPAGEDKKYRERLNYEIGVLGPIGLASYFLIVHDIMKWGQDQGWLMCGRGSAGGSIISYLLNVTESDPIQYNLIFERFYNAGRNTPGKVSLPDIDFDIPILKREQVLNYIRDKYGRNKTGSIATFGGMKGAAALGEVLRAKNVCSNEEIKQITKMVISEHKISDELEELRKEGQEATILGWCLDNDSRFKQYAYYDDDGNVVGDYGIHFAQAMRLENCKRNLGKHAAGLVVSSEPLAKFCPMVHAKNSDELMVGWEMGDAEAGGCLKLDALGVAVMDDMMETIRLVNEGDL